MPIKEITLDDLINDSNWAEVFADKNSGNVDKSTEPLPPDSDVNTLPASRGDVTEIVAAVNGDNDGPDWVGVFLLKDGRYLVASGGCDYTGWDCYANNNLAVAKTLQEAIRFGLSDGERKRLDLELT